jgi:hypothetical protein
VIAYLGESERLFPFGSSVHNDPIVVHRVHQTGRTDARDLQGPVGAVLSVDALRLLQLVLGQNEVAQVLNQPVLELFVVFVVVFVAVAYHTSENTKSPADIHENFGERSSTRNPELHDNSRRSSITR